MAAALGTHLVKQHLGQVRLTGSQLVQLLDQGMPTEEEVGGPLHTFPAEGSYSPRVSYKKHSWKGRALPCLALPTEWPPHTLY